ncbi:MAG: HAD hydrolase-like protein [Bifidobacteriaceae bacterium]|jgi:phosphoglycolate phosphatase|nr:HAD hydrolase-like protein [Bifidobacteriaceae bacterium]MCI1914680.1 HAD hydrolase-like protein [Bifidobacteriaceae bacterium]
MEIQGRRIVLLDLDGTLTESGPGISASVRLACKAIGLDLPNAAELQRFIGPPIGESLERNGVTGDDITKGVQVYRNAYANPTFPDPLNPGKLVPGMYLNSVYKGIPEALTTLRHEGYILATATAKPEPQAIPVCERFGITPLVDHVYGATLDASRRHKADVIRYALAGLKFSKDAGDRVVMVGDRWTDVDGAHKVGIDTIGVRWGYAEAGELEKYGAVDYAAEPSDLPSVVDRYFAA